MKISRKLEDYVILPARSHIHPIPPDEPKIETRPSMKICKSTIETDIGWLEAGKRLQKEGFAFPTIRDFLDYYIYLQRGYNEGINIYDGRGNILRKEELKNLLGQINPFYIEDSEKIKEIIKQKQDCPETFNDYWSEMVERDHSERRWRSHPPGAIYSGNIFNYDGNLDPLNIGEWRNLKPLEKYYIRDKVLEDYVNYSFKPHWPMREVVCDMGHTDYSGFPILYPDYALPTTVPQKYKVKDEPYIKERMIEWWPPGDYPDKEQIPIFNWGFFGKYPIPTFSWMNAHVKGRINKHEHIVLSFRPAFKI